MKRIFISSVQREFAEVRKLLKRYIARNPAYRRLFDTFVFEEDVVSQDRRTDEVYIDELKKCDIYLGLIGNEYGFEDAEGVSPTEREYDEATRLGMPRLMFVLDSERVERTPKEDAFLRKISTELIRSRCLDQSSLLLEIYSSLDALLLEQGAYRMEAFDASVCGGATLDDIDEKKVSWFIERARTLRKANLEEGMAPTSVFTHLRLFAVDGGITNAAMLLFGKDPQRFILSSEVKCVQWYGTERHKPMLSYQIFRGTLFDMADEATAFVLSKLDLRNGTRANGTTAPREYEIPQSVIAEAIINAIAHRDYASTGSVQVEVFSDRVVVRNPGQINPALTKADLYIEHSSYPNNPKIAEALYQTKHIEKFGTGFTDLVADCRAVGLPEPTVDDSRTEFVVTIYRATNKSQITTNKSQINGVDRREPGIVTRIVENIRKDPKITISEQAKAVGLTENKVRGIIDKLREFGILTRKGARRNGQWCVASWVNDKVLEIEDEGLRPVHITENGQIEVEVEFDFSKKPELRLKLEKLAHESGLTIEEVVRKCLLQAVQEIPNEDVGE